MTISEFCIKRPVATMMIIISMVGIGIISLINLKTELFPDFNAPVAMISTKWRGASPDDMEKLITKKIEDSISSVKGIKKISTVTKVGTSDVIVKFDYGVNIDTKVNDLVVKLSNIKSQLPKNLTEEPVVEKMDSSEKITLMVTVSGGNLIKLKSFVKNTIKPRLNRIEGVSKITISGGYDRQLLIEIDPNKLESYGINISSLYTLLERSSLNFPTGYIREGGKEYLVKILGEAKTLEDIKDIVIKNDGKDILFLSDVANVRLDVKDLDNYGRTDGKDNILISVGRTNKGNAAHISKIVKKELKELKSQFPEGATYNISGDTSIDIKNSISSVKNSALTGLVLAIIILFIFLKDIRATLVIALSIPISIISTFAMFSIRGMSLNIISLMGLSLGIGMLVDNSIIVIDNIFRHLTELKKPKLEAARDGTNEMIVPIIASTATTIAVFLPIVFQKGMAREVFQDMSYSVIFSLIASLIVAITFIPMICSRIISEKKRLEKEGKFLSILKDIYTKLLKSALKKKLTVLVGTMLIFITVIWFGVTKIGGEFFPTIDNGTYTIVGEMPKGIDIDKANHIAKIYEKAVKKNSLTKTYTTTVRKDFLSISVDIGKPNMRDKSVFQAIEEIRSEISWVPDVKLSIGPEESEGGDKDISLLLKSNDDAQLKKYANLIMKKIEKIDGLTDFSNSMLGGNPEARLALNRKKLKYYGINVNDLTFAISYQILGGSPIKIKASDEELDVTLQLEKKYRESTDLLMNARVTTGNGSSIKLSQIASLNIVEGPAAIKKEDKVKKVTLQANNKKGMDLVTGQKKIKQIIKELKLPKNISYSFGGNGQELQDVTSQLVFAFLVAVFLIYFILAAQFESYILPFIVMGSVPLSLIGVYSGLFITGEKTNIFVFVGIIMLAGIVVNNAIVLIDYINLLKIRGADSTNAIIEAGRTRLRPIIMTTMTTVFGMFPMAFGIGQGSETYKGMAIAVIFGLTFSTLLTLIFIPVLYSIYSGFKIKLEIWIESKVHNKKIKS